MYKPGLPELLVGQEINPWFSATLTDNIGVDGVDLSAQGNNVLLTPLQRGSGPKTRKGHRCKEEVSNHRMSLAQVAHSK